MKHIISIILAVMVLSMIFIAGCTSTEQSISEPETITTLPTQTTFQTQTPVQTSFKPTVDPTHTTNTGSDELRIGAFNVQVFGVSKASKPEVMSVLADTIRTFDIVSIEEIRDSSQTALPDLVNLVNSDGSQYEYVVGERLGRTSSKEQYAYIYNTKTAVLTSTPYTYPEPAGTDPFHREPYIASFGAINGDFDATMITVHTDPDEATEEINSLDAVVDYAVSHTPYDQDVIVMGDFNADGSYFKEDCSSSMTSSEYEWIIGNDVDTTTKSTDYTYDRIVLTKSVTPYFTGDAGVFRYDTQYGLTQDETEDVSDHYPVYAIFFTGGTGTYNSAVTTTIPTPVHTDSTTISTTIPTTIPTTSNPTPVTSGTSDVYISGISLEDEWVKITNKGSSVNLKGWYIQDDDAKHTYTFPSITLVSESTVTLHSEKGTDTSTELYWDGKNVWNNDGDTAYLYDSSGKLVSQKKG
ncbi:lamin tail domain-containing protein [Methanogenium organophilum]|uniref:Lamin tail domain-containing protein n=1 Tax=Methanogenium organophilum TaxID=2199 RepID=A0A9X9S5M9_METOG|nr:lamin tail domain-containing protein [Methanogenium organophilum]WAI01355.1 lamin tail domain-containing protein [Methanogenium organophilum]